MARVKPKALDNIFLICTRCSNRVSEDSKMIYISDFNDVVHGSFRICDQCASNIPIPVRSGRPDLIMEWLSNDLVEPIIYSRFNVHTWDICQKLEYLLGPNKYHSEIARIIREKDPGNALATLWQTTPKS